MKKVFVYPNPIIYCPIKIDVPDFFVTGHIHKAKIGQHGKVTLVSSSCWQGKTDFQEKLGHSPEPCRVPIINLKNREAKIMKFI